MPTSVSVLDSSGSPQTVNTLPALGQGAKVGSLPVVLASDDDIQVKLGIVTETAPATDTGSSGLNGRLQRLAQRLTSLIGLLPASLGQTTKTGSLSVSVASDDDLQGKLGSLTETAPATDTAASGLNGRLQRVAQRLTSLAAQLPATLGSLTSANSLSIVHANDDALIGTKTETAPGTDTASSGLNGRLQRIAQRLTSLIAQLPATLGQAARASSLSVALSTEDATNLATVATAAADSTTPNPVTVKNVSYETVAASQTDQVMGASGAAGDILSQVLIIPTTTSPGAVSIKDGVGSAVTIFAGGASSVSNLVPFAVPLGVVAVTNWKITTGANVSAIGIGKFS